MLDFDKPSYRASIKRKATISKNYNEQLPRIKKRIMTPALASALDRTCTSDRNAMFILSATTTSLGLNINDYYLSSSTVRRSRIENRKALTNELKNCLQTASHLVAHFDGKLLEDIAGKEIIDRIPVPVSGLDTSHLLGAPKIRNGTGEQQADAVVQTLREWKLDECVKALCFDTTAANTGNYVFFLFYSHH